MKEINREAEIFTTDSNKWETSLNDYLPGGVASIFLSKCIPLVN